MRYLRKQYKVVNRGINGDTTICTYQRLQEYIRKPKEDTDLYIIEIGTNDILIPYISTVSALWNIQMKPRVKRKKCILERQQFIKKYKNYIQLIQSHKKKMIVIGLSLIQLKNYPIMTFDHSWKHKNILRNTDIF